jgi:hypothetical protein
MRNKMSNKMQTIRNTEITRRALTEKVTLQTLAKEYSVSRVRIRQIINSFCRRHNLEVFDKLSDNSKFYLTGWSDDKRPPYLSELRANANLFLGK